MTTPAATPSQTIGPFFRFAMAWMNARKLVPDGSAGALTLIGRIVDGAGDPVPDAMVEIWQADAIGRFPPETATGWTGFGRCLVDAEGAFEFTTVKPGPLAGRPGGAGQAPHIDVSVFARGLLQRLVTRVYFPDEAAANAADPVLLSIDDTGLRSRLVARPDPDAGRLRFDVHLQGDAETPFFVY
jgi:protocatechuate 3,4-dioxygenase, alpha subunit